MVGIELTFSSPSNEEIPIIKLGSKSFPTAISLPARPGDKQQALTVSMSCPTGEMVRPLNMSQMAFTQEQVTVQVYTVYSILICYFSGHSEAKRECQEDDLSLS